MQLSFDAWVYLSLAAMALVVGIFVLVKNPKSLVHRSFLFLLAGLSVMITGFVFLSEQLPFEIFDKPIHYGGLVFLSGLVFFSQVFPKKEYFQKSKWLIFIPFIILAGIIPFNLLIHTAYFDPIKGVVPVNGPLFAPYIVFWISYFLYAFSSLIRTYRKAQGSERTQMQYLYSGISIFVLCMLLFNFVLPWLGISYLYPIGPFSSIIFIGFTAVAIVRHELMDIKIVIQRGLVYTILFVIFVGLYVLLLEILGHMIHSITQFSAILSGALTTVLGIFFIRPLEEYFQKITDPVFFKHKYNYAEALYSLSHVMYFSLNEADIISKSESTLRSIFKTDTASIVLDPNAVQQLSVNDQSAGFATLSHPIMIEDRVIGILKLGKKHSGDSYTTQDLQLVSTFTFQAAISLSKAKLHKKIQEYNLHLEQLVEERTTELKRLQEDQKQAMVDISHNLQTPLAIIRGELELLSEHSADAEKMFTVRKSLDRVSSFIRQLLHLARLEHSVYSVEQKPINISKLLESQVDYFEVMAQENGVEIISSIQPDALVSGDKRLLEEAFVNLASNAIKYRHPERPAFLKITLVKTEKNVMTWIEDNGIGIPPENIPDLFNRFYRVASSQMTVRGTGLGLAIVKKIIEKHGGTIDVESIFGEKTLFRVCLPRFEK